MNLVRMAFAVSMMSAVAVSQQLSSYELGGIALGTSMSKFRRIHPTANCLSLGEGEVSCALFNSVGFENLQSSRTNYNFKNGSLTDIAILYKTTPPASRIEEAVHALTRKFGKPEKIDAYVLRWSKGHAELTLYLPKPSWPEFSVGFVQR